MGSVALLQSLKESILSGAGVKAIYGEPISAQGKTIVPVAKLMYGYGAGAGTGGVGNSSAQGGGGAGVRAIPVGVIEISDHQTRFIPITSPILSPSAAACLYAHENRGNQSLRMPHRGRLIERKVHCNRRMVRQIVKRR